MVSKMGVRKWIDLQLHPDQIPENPELAAKLEPLESLRLSQAEAPFAPARCTASSPAWRPGSSPAYFPDMARLDLPDSLR